MALVHLWPRGVAVCKVNGLAAVVKPKDPAASLMLPSGGAPSMLRSHLVYGKPG